MAAARAIITTNDTVTTQSETSRQAPPHAARSLATGLPIPAPRPTGSIRSIRRKRIRISLWILFLAGGLITVVALLYMHRGDAEGSARTANQEIEFLLRTGETVAIRVPVMQRRWWNYFRVTHGVLAATSQRLMYVGVPPEELLPREPEPRDLEEYSWWLDRQLELRAGSMFLGRRYGVTVAGRTRQDDFVVAKHDIGRLDSLVAAVRARQQELSAIRAAERRALEAAAIAARRPIYHLIQPGDALEVIAVRYGTRVDSLRAWNGLTSDRIRAGQRILVRPGR
jgi:hypothetical protein